MKKPANIYSMTIYKADNSRNLIGLFTGDNPRVTCKTFQGGEMIKNTRQEFSRDEVAYIIKAHRKAGDKIICIAREQLH